MKNYPGTALKDGGFLECLLMIATTKNRKTSEDLTGSIKQNLINVIFDYWCQWINW